MVATALGGEAVTTTVEGRERYTVNVRYPRALRSDPQAIATRRAGADYRAAARCRWARWPRSRLTEGPANIRTENAQLAVYVYVDFRDRDIAGYVADAQKAVAEQVHFPPGYYVDLERPVRVPAAGGGAAEDRRAGDAADHLPAALPQLPARDRDA